MLGVVSIVVLQDQASVDTFLYLSLYLISLLESALRHPRFHALERAGGNPPGTPP